MTGSDGNHDYPYHQITPLLKNEIKLILSLFHVSFHIVLQPYDPLRLFSGTVGYRLKMDHPGSRKFELSSRKASERNASE
jgi:hypothetical protein